MTKLEEMEQEMEQDYFVLPAIAPESIKKIRENIEDGSCETCQ